MDRELNGSFGPEDERAHFIPPTEAHEDEAEEARVQKLDQLQPTGNLITDAVAYYGAEGYVPPQIVQDGNEERTLALLRRRHDGYAATVKRISEHSYDHPNETGHMSHPERDFYKSAASALERILNAHESK